MPPWKGKHRQEPPIGSSAPCREGARIYHCTGLILKASSQTRGAETLRHDAQRVVCEASPISSHERHHVSIPKTDRALLRWVCHKESKLECRLEVMILAEVRLQEGESVENALRRFKRKVQTEDIIKEVKRHSFYLKPGAKRRVKQALARKRARKKLRKDAD